jgi:hypothetical protein
MLVLVGRRAGGGRLAGGAIVASYIAYVGPDADPRLPVGCLALARGYDATLVSDAHTTEDQTAWGAPPPDKVIAHTNLYWTYQTAPGRTAGAVDSKDVDFGGQS